MLSVRLLCLPQEDAVCFQTNAQALPSLCVPGNFMFLEFYVPLCRKLIFINYGPESFSNFYVPSCASHILLVCSLSGKS